MPFDLTQTPRWAAQIELLRGLVETLGEDLSCDFSDVHHVGEVEEIECHSRDGFIAWTNGGFELVAYADFNSARGSGRIPNAIQGMLDQDLSDTAERWLQEKAEGFGYDPEVDYGGAQPGDHVGAAWAFLWHLEDEEERLNKDLLPGPWPRTGQSNSEAARESLYEWEDASLSEGTTYFYKVRAQLYAADSADNTTGEDEVYVWAAINTDLEYGRDHIGWLRAYGSDPNQNKGGHCETIKLAELTEEKIEELRSKLYDGMRGA